MRKKGREQSKPSYRDALQAIGRYFDQQMYRGVFVAEVDDGYIGKARPAEQEAELHAEGFTFPHSDVQSLIKSMATVTATPDSAPDFCPYGYGLFMAAAGEMCDRTGARLISILEVTDGFVLSFTAPRASGHGLERRCHRLGRPAIEELLNRAGFA